MTAPSKQLPAPLWFHPLAAAPLSLLAVTGFTLVLGAFFLPAEALRLNPPQRVSVTHVLPPDDQHHSVVLYWSIPERGLPGWRHHLSVAGLERQYFDDDNRPLEPLTITSVPGTSQSIIGNWDGSLYLLDHELPSGPPTLLGRQPDGGVIDVVCSPDGRLAVSMNAFSLYGWDVVARRELWRRGDIQASCLMFGARGATVIVGDTRGDVVELDARTGDLRRKLLQPESPAVALALSPDAERLALLAADGQLHFLNSRSLTTEWTTSIGWQLAAGRFMAFAPRGDLLVTTDPGNPHALALLDPLQKKRHSSLIGHEGIVLGAAFSADGTLWSWGADGSVLTWDLARRRPAKVTRHAPPERSSS